MFLSLLIVLVLTAQSVELNFVNMGEAPTIAVQSRPDAMNKIARNDWVRLLDVFRATEATVGIRDLTNDKLQSTKEQDQSGNDSECLSVDNFRVRVDTDGFIVSIEQMGHLPMHQLTDFAIGDFGKLPRRLKELHLMNMQLTRLDLNHLPQALEVLLLVNTGALCRVHLDVDSLPPTLKEWRMSRIAFVDFGVRIPLDMSEFPKSLEMFHMERSNVIAVDLQTLPRSLKQLWLNHNLLTQNRINLTALSTGLEVLRLDGNQGIQFENVNLNCLHSHPSLKQLYISDDDVTVLITTKHGVADWLTDWGFPKLGTWLKDHIMTQKHINSSHQTTKFVIC